MRVGGVKVYTAWQCLWHPMDRWVAHPQWEDVVTVQSLLSWPPLASSLTLPWVCQDEAWPACSPYRFPDRTTG